MNTKNLIGQLNNLVDQAPIQVINEALTEAEDRIIGYLLSDDDQGAKQTIKSILTDLIKDLTPARVEIHETNFTDRQTNAALFVLLQELPRVDEYTNNPDVIDYAEQLAQKILYAAEHATPDTDNN